LKNKLLKRYMIDSAPSYMQDLIPNQIQQTWIRLSVCMLGTIYLLIHAVNLNQYIMVLSYIGGFYVAWQLYTLSMIRKKPLSFSRMVLSPLLDAIFLSSAIFADGGQFSPLYLFYFASIMGNGMRFGTPTLIYSQILSIIAFSIVCFYLWLSHGIALDLAVFALQFLTLILLPNYTQQANMHAHRAVNAKKDAESTEFQLLDKSPIAAFTFERHPNGQLCIAYVNQSMQQLYSQEISRLIGFPVEDIFSSEDGREIQHACQSVFEHENAPSKAFYIRAHGEHRDTLQLMGQARSITFHGKIIGICFLSDITQHQDFNLKMQQTMQEAYMGTLVAGMVHDFRNVLTSIIGTAEVMQFSQTDQKTIDELELIIQAGEHGADMITNLLTLGKASEQENTDQEKDITKTLSSMIDLLRIQLPNSIDLNLYMQEPLPPTQINVTQMEQILMNLIKNAAEATHHEGKIDVHIYPASETTSEGQNLATLNISVADHGVGIAPENLDKVTKAFWTSRKDSGGTGLGLAMVQRIVRQHNGTFHIDSQLNVGTTITLTFPAITTTKKSSELSASQKTAQKTAPMKNWSILIVDDNDDVLLVHQHMLERMGHQLTTAHSGQAALNILDSNPNQFDLIITDFMMPHMDGIDLCTTIRQQSATLPLMMITAFGNAEKLQQTEELSIRLLYKPISFKKLQESILEVQHATL